MWEDCILQRAIFLLALVTRYRDSQLAALTNHSAISTVEEDNLTLIVYP